MLCVSIFEKIWHLPEILWDIEEINRKKKRRLGIMMFLKIEKKYYEDVSQQIMQMMMCFPSTEVLKISWMWALSSDTPNLQIHGKILQNILLDWVNQKRLFLKCQNYLWILASQIKIVKGCLFATIESQCILLQSKVLFIWRLLIWDLWPSWTNKLFKVTLISNKMMMIFWKWDFYLIICIVAAEMTHGPKFNA